jgi:hypothetical protein
MQTNKLTETRLVEIESFEAKNIKESDSFEAKKSKFLIFM